MEGGQQPATSSLLAATTFPTINMAGMAVAGAAAGAMTDSVRGSLLGLTGGLASPGGVVRWELSSVTIVHLLCVRVRGYLFACVWMRPAHSVCM